MAALKKGFNTDYKLKQKGNGVYLFLIDGDITVNNQKLNRRDGIGIWETEQFAISADSNAEILTIEVPMN